jgi:predicted small secreted protein
MKESTFVNGRAATLLKVGGLLLSLLAAASCNTVEGAGQDIRNAGAWSEKKASSNK